MDSPWYSEKIQQLIAEEKRRQLEKLQHDAMERAEKIAALLKKKYGVSRIILYGSLAEGGFSEGSDIDLMIEGFRGSFWRMYSEAGMLADPFPLSIVCREDAVSSLVDHALRRGLVL